MCVRERCARQEFDSLYPATAYYAAVDAHVSDFSCIFT